MVRLANVVYAALVFALITDGFAFTIGGPVAAQDFRVKGAAFVFRTERCAEPARPEISATAEGLLKRERRSVALQLVTTSKPGIYAVVQNWPSEGDWVVNLRGTCAAATAGAIVPIARNGFVRDASKFFSRPATEAEIRDALEAWAHRTNR
jgi:hypothetical protein